MWLNSCLTKCYFNILPLLKLYFIYESFLLMPQVTSAQPYKHEQCSARLENALEHMRRRSLNIKSARTLWNETPYDIYNKFYGNHESEEDERLLYNTGRNYNEHPTQTNHNSVRPALDHGHAQQQAYNKPPNRLAVTGVEVEDLKVRLPQKLQARWVEIDKCKFSTENATLDTRLIFPDLTLSGRIVLQPTGGKCNMILRLRHAGIEFRTIPIGFNTKHHSNEESRRLSAATVRTDSHFAEPGFISVFAHGCQGPTGIKLRQNSKRRFGFINEHLDEPTAPQVEISDPHVILGGAGGSKRWGKFHNLHQPSYDIRSESYKQAAMRDQDIQWENESGSQEYFDINGDNFYRKKFNRRRRRDLRNLQYLNRRKDGLDDILNFNDNDFDDLIQPDARAFADIFAQNNGYGSSSLFSGNSENADVSDALTMELEKLFSLGVRGLLTTYMQKTLQPAIKETLMENMGFRLSYG